MIIECYTYPSPQVECKKCNIRFFEKSGLKNVASRPVRDVMWRGEHVVPDGRWVRWKIGVFLPI